MCILRSWPVPRGPPLIETGKFVRNPSNGPPGSAKSRVLNFPLALFALFALSAIVYLYVSNVSNQGRGRVAGETAEKRNAGRSPQEIYETIVERTRAIDAQFQQVYSAGWEGANGAIGEAFLFAATGDSSLLKVYTDMRKFTELQNGTWVDDRAWVCLAELYWWQFSGRRHSVWVEDAKNRYDEARREGRLSNHEGFWSWYNWPSHSRVNEAIITNSNMNQMVTVACLLYDATHEQRFYQDALVVWEGDAKYPGIEKTFYRGIGRWEGKGGSAAFGRQLPWEDASYCSVVSALYRMTGDAKYKEIAAASARRAMDPANGWVDPVDYYQLAMDGNGAFVHFILDAYLIAPELLPDIPDKIEKMLQHVWTNHHGECTVVLHRPSDDGIRNGWNPYGGEEGYNVNEVGTVHAQSQAVRAFGLYAYALHNALLPQHP